MGERIHRKRRRGRRFCIWYVGFARCGGLGGVEARKEWVEAGYKRETVSERGSASVRQGAGGTRKRATLAVRANRRFAPCAARRSTQPGSSSSLRTFTQTAAALQMTAARDHRAARAVLFRSGRALMRSCFKKRCMAPNASCMRAKMANTNCSRSGPMITGVEGQPDALIITSKGHHPRTSA
eukprot:6202839-Pleurochrysis_carterae.AAC.2